MPAAYQRESNGWIADTCDQNIAVAKLDGNPLTDIQYRTTGLGVQPPPWFLSEHAPTRALSCGTYQFKV
jgi:hypothetical protein